MIRGFMRVGGGDLKTLFISLLPKLYESDERYEKIEKNRKRSKDEVEDYHSMIRYGLIIDGRLAFK